LKNVASPPMWNWVWNWELGSDHGERLVIRDVF
jgi:hypothetical protein